MVQQAAAQGIFTTNFDILTGYDHDTSLPNETQLSMATALLKTDLFNEFV